MDKAEADKLVAELEKLPPPRQQGLVRELHHLRNSADRQLHRSAGRRALEPARLRGPK